MEKHHRHYTSVEGFDASFPRAVSDGLDQLEPRQGEAESCFLIAEAHSPPRTIGCAFLVAESPEAARLRLFYLEADYRGQGIGQRMLDRLIPHAMAQGMRLLRVSTFERHAAACGLYRANGFRETRHAPGLAFGQMLSRLDFEKPLSR